MAELQYLTYITITLIIMHNMRKSDEVLKC
jgi:hypothetical protein